MRILIGAVVALSFAGAAFAQNDPAPAAPAAGSQCAAVGAEPAYPDPATATPQTIQAANEAYRAWATAAQESLRCRQAEVQPLQTRLSALTEEHNAIVNRVNTNTQAWTAVTTAYCAREGVRCQRNEE